MTQSFEKPICFIASTFEIPSGRDVLRRRHGDRKFPSGVQRILKQHFGIVTRTSNISICRFTVSGYSVGGEGTAAFAMIGRIVPEKQIESQ